MKILIKKYQRTLGEILFFGFIPESIKEFNIVSRILLYTCAALFFYLPSLYFIVYVSMTRTELLPYLLCMVVLHILAKLLLCNSKKIQRYFSSAKTMRYFFMRIIYIVQYVILMWLVYLLYPIACILFPAGMLVLAAEHLAGGQILVNALEAHWQSALLFGSIASYIIFIIADGYHKIKTGFLPDYLGLYAVLSVVSGTISSLEILQTLHFGSNQFIIIISELFRLSNTSMNIVSSAIMFSVALYSLYTTCGMKRCEEQER